MPERFYRQQIPQIELSIERATESVPDDNKYYVIQNGQPLGSFRSLKPAQQLFRRVLADSGYTPKPVETQKSVSEMVTERYMEAKDAYWANSHRYRSGGGKGR